jgi:hypothetical protein
MTMPRWQGSVKLTLYFTSTQHKVGQVAERLKAHAWKACIRL